MKRDILNHLGQKIGELELPDDTAEQVWAERLALYAVPPATVTLTEVVKSKILAGSSFWNRHH